MCCRSFANLLDIQILLSYRQITKLQALCAACRSYSISHFPYYVTVASFAMCEINGKGRPLPAGTRRERAPGIPCNADAPIIIKAYVRSCEPADHQAGRPISEGF